MVQITFSSKFCNVHQLCMYFIVLSYIMVQGVVFYKSYLTNTVNKRY